MLIYLLKANIILVLFYLAYRFGLRRLTFYTLNRFFLIAAIICAAAGPLIDPSVFIQHHHGLNAVAETLPDLSMFRRSEKPLINQVLEYIFWGGVWVMGTRLLIQLLSLLKLHKNTTKRIYGNERLRVTARRVNPFSFMRNIYINPSLHSPEELISIIRHEQVHVRQWHTLDVLLGELTRIFYWFNPGAWLMSIAIRENLEFITDRCVLQQGMDAKAYQYSLIKVSGIPYATAIANNFNFSHLKQRIMMMNKKRSSRYQLVRYAVLGAIIGIAVLSLNFTRAAVKAETSARHITALVLPYDTVKPAPVIFTAPPPPPPAPPAPAPAARQMKGKPVPPPPPPQPIVEEIRMEPVTTPMPASALGALVEDMEERPLPGGGVAIRKANPEVKMRPVFYVDDVHYGLEAPANLNTNDISSVNVLKGETAVKLYGSEAKDGAVLIYTKAYIGDASIRTTQSVKTVTTVDGVKIQTTGTNASAKTAEQTSQNKAQ
ncbi:M56 family metallopeptidase [Chitinophaga rhizophila]|uniref:M56 family metallopeptidase n=1 Tax=Chitinophaga rhizophila TaxID=2866212 RepID=A0ABS7G8I7_9BACT|nr:M56 family metallopeptidase [Chitinophaga rhizophila]MBW8683099.1 M56 family metallopeptidase [Chitinophaga rhizophila]